jgi:hypothetical protein
MASTAADGGGALVSTAYTVGARQALFLPHGNSIAPRQSKIAVERSDAYDSGEDSDANEPGSTPLARVNEDCA